jgi:hypothetical protein
MPQRLTRDAADLVDPVWSPDGGSVIVARGAGATAAGRTITANAYYDLVRTAATPPTGGDTGEVVTTVGRPPEAALSGEARRQLLRPSFGPEGRLFYPEERPAPAGQPAGGRGGGGTALVSVKPDGSDRTVHAILPNADEIVRSPDGNWVAFQEGDNVYMAPMKWSGAGAEPVRIDKKRGELPVTSLTRDGGLFPRWRDKNTLEFGSGNQMFVRHVDSGLTDTVTLNLTVPRAVPAGSVALTGARLITLDHKKVIDSGTIVIRGSRIACVGACATVGVDRVIDVRGKTIIPGWVDMHAHHHREWRGMRPKHDYEVAMYLAYGVTTDLDPSMWSQNILTGAYSDGLPFVGSSRRAENLVDRHCQHRLRPSRRPVDSFILDTIVLPEPNDCDVSAFGIDDPVLGDASVEVKRLLLLAITTPRAGRDDLHDEQRNRPRFPARDRVWMRQPNHEIRLDLRAPRLNHGARAVHVTEPVRGDEGRKDSVEPRRDLLVVHGRRRCHEQFSAHQLVLVAVVGQTVELLERPHLCLCRHGNGHTPLGCE